MTTSPLGEYIHLKYESYMAYGTAREGSSQTIYSSYQAQKKKNNEVIEKIKDIDIKTLNALERALTRQK